MPERRGAVLILALIAIAVLGGRTLIDRSSQPGPVGLAVAAAVPGATIFELGAQLDRYRVEQASAHLARLETARKARQAALKRKRERFSRLPGSVSRATLESIASCESGGDPRIVSANGLYHGKYQFSLSTWVSVGGAGSPAAASESEQDYRAALLYQRSGPGQWPVCGA